MVKRKDVRDEVREVLERRANLTEEPVPYGMTRMSATERRMLNGYHYQQCGGGRRVIKKKLVNMNY